MDQNMNNISIRPDSMVVPLDSKERAISPYDTFFFSSFDSVWVNRYIMSPISAIEDKNVSPNEIGHLLNPTNICQSFILYAYNLYKNTDVNAPLTCANT